MSSNLSVQDIINQINDQIINDARVGNRLSSLTYQKQAVDISKLEEAKIVIEELGYQVKIITDNPTVNTIQVHF
ncbi:hypothetical protein RMB03_16355 [Acinetobacter sp. V91_7]|jgi:hypothetical protein|uniref:hypothetical protein n=1 Tax=unclassified Acinetobacter TaxID=196816 RepID=UPI00287EA2BF|nr:MULTISPECIES: hypothetical protein [unclassified Acinetobacter]MDS7931156.1 hypothetical protein [Acinetobacter sp. V102_4]MDS7935871.1 hypothetical protein [Acinetobacter sp. V91_4B]MDS7964521.1 hypothetical protein [Acinetobacter sp. V91_7]MDS8025784.1 hypothetical protein [Acinetobacter sp. V91_13]